MKSAIWPATFCLTLFVMRALSATHYVGLNSTNPISPFADWSTAATNIQDAIDASTNGDLVLVTNGVYQTGGRVIYGSVTNRVVVTNGITVQSVNGPTVTLIEGNSIIGSNAVRCVLISNSVLAGFTITNGGTLNSGDFFADESGGGVWASGAVISNCVFIKNVSAGLGGGAYSGNIYNSQFLQNSAYEGGGLAYGTASNCLFWSNSASAYGGGTFDTGLRNCIIMQNVAQWAGGADGGNLYGCLIVSNSASGFPGGGFPGGVSGGNIVNCTIVDNTAYQGVGGVSGAATLYNSIIYYNTVYTNGVPDYNGGSAFYCCTPISGNAIGTITNEPGFVDLANGDFHLASNSPCINGGHGGDISPNRATDLDGSPRTVDGFVDMGAYEYQTPGFILPYYWAQEYGLSVNDGTKIDPYADGMNYWWVAVTGANPTNAASILRLSISNSVSGIAVTWPGVANKAYYLQRSTNLMANPAFISIYTNHVFSFPMTLGFMDNSATNSGPYFYRVGVLY